MDTLLTVAISETVSERFVRISETKKPGYQKLADGVWADVTASQKKQIIKKLAELKAVDDFDPSGLFVWLGSLASFSKVIGSIPSTDQALLQFLVFSVEYLALPRDTFRLAYASLKTRQKDVNFSSLDSDLNKKGLIDASD